MTTSRARFTPPKNCNYRFTVAYDGTDLAGWQIQPGKRTVQGQLERALSHVAKTRVKVTGASRTDAGVHARGQIAAAYVPDWPATPHDLMRAANGKLPTDVSILDCHRVHDRFHPIREAIGKRYEYRLHCGGPRDPFGIRYAWHVFQPLDLPAMQFAARTLVGIHDFNSFQTNGANRRTTVRHVRHLELQGIGPSGAGQQIVLAIEADGFLYNMVRNIVGSLVLIGRGKRTPEWMSEVLAQRNRQASGPTAPPEGLCLMRVDFPQHVADEAQEIAPAADMPNVEWELEAYE